MRTALLIATLLVLGSCGSTDSPSDGPRVVATTTMLGDIVESVVGEAATVETLLPIGTDPHDYRPSAQEVAALVSADLVVANGLELEEGLNDVLENAADDGVTVLRIGELVDPIPFSSDPTELDPHVWLDPLRMADAARLIGDALATLDSSADWAARAAGYGAELEAADEEIIEILKAVQNRQLVTSHDSLSYFADRYDFEVLGVVIPGGSTLADPSSAELAALAEAITAADVAAIFAETTEPSALAEAVAAEVGTSVAVVELYTGSLGEPGSGADTLIGMLTTNARRIADALG
ncbi:MAG: zinc ABC transporter substrate-binding protein [Acidimicrobiia bacterium]|nr:metal ABC transporter substrate-binding protein [Acidimicrobiia bacterium]MBT8217176.1 metal ABC transporter substrate-binding protein [Acidimicrobiia bacterium]NNF10101.1 zinc ABC transporter substrate-binding protein [Acidimicrobiia bacterium]NNL68615.1 zinc ABC transporter substrate-binding protein [Acidimicrobiia bacterium]